VVGGKLYFRGEPEKTDYDVREVLSRASRQVARLFHIAATHHTGYDAK
jgi:hypothetical protein